MDHITLADINFPDCCDIAKVRRMRRVEQVKVNEIYKNHAEELELNEVVLKNIYSKQQLIKLLERKAN